MGSGGLRAWEKLVKGVYEAIADFEMVHGIDTAIGRYLVSEARDTITWVR